MYNEVYLRNKRDDTVLVDHHMGLYLCNPSGLPYAPKLVGLQTIILCTVDDLCIDFTFANSCCTYFISVLNKTATLDMLHIQIDTN